MSQMGAALGVHFAAVGRDDDVVTDDLLRAEGRPAVLGTLSLEFLQGAALRHGEQRDPTCDIVKCGFAVLSCVLLHALEKVDERVIQKSGGLQASK